MQFSGFLNETISEKIFLQQHVALSNKINKFLISAAFLGLASIMCATYASAQVRSSLASNNVQTSKDALDILSLRFDETGVDETSIEVLRRNQFVTTQNYTLKLKYETASNAYREPYITDQAYTYYGSRQLNDILVLDNMLLAKDQLNIVKNIKHTGSVRSSSAVSSQDSFKIDPALDIFKPLSPRQRYQIFANGLDQDSSVMVASVGKAVLGQTIKTLGTSQSGLEELLP